MASIASSSSSVSFHDQERLDLKSVRVLVTSINQHINEFLAETKTRKSQKLNCAAKLTIQKQEFFEFSEHSIVSNLYWGIENVETALQTKSPAEKTSRLKNSEQMLQVPASLNENGETAGISNCYLVCCSYFYLAVVRKLQGDEWQAALHLLQALLVSPRLVRTEFAPKVCESLFLSCSVSERQKIGAGRNLESTAVMESEEDEICKVDEAIRQVVRRYKARLVYYQVMSYGKTQWHCGSRHIASVDDESQHFTTRESTSTESSNWYDGESSLQAYQNFEKVHPIEHTQECTSYGVADENWASTNIPKFQECIKAPVVLDHVSTVNMKRSSRVNCLQDMLQESQSDTPISVDSCDHISTDEHDFKEYAHETESSMRIVRIKADDQQSEIYDERLQAPHPILNSESTTSSQGLGHPMQEEPNDGNITKLPSGRIAGSSDVDLSISIHKDTNSHASWDCPLKGRKSQRRPDLHDLQHFNVMGTRTHQHAQMNCQGKGSFARRKHNSSSQKNLNQICLYPQKYFHTEPAGMIGKAISKLCFLEKLGKCDEDYTVEITGIYEMFYKRGVVKYSLLKDVILDQLLLAISSSKEKGIIRASVSILSAIISGNKSVVEDVKKKGLQLCDLASALRRNINEAAILLYLINPSPAEIMTLELLPALVEVVCTTENCKSRVASILLTPPAASVMIIEVLVTACDYATNNINLAAISSPRVLSALLDVARNNILGEISSLATILVRCMQFNGQCRKYISQFAPTAPFLSLLRSKQKHAKCIALEFFHEILRIPRSSAIGFLQQIRKEGSINIMRTLLILNQQLQPKYKLLASNLLLQLVVLEDSSGRSVFRDEAVEILLESITSEENYATQQLSAVILSNLGGTYAWTGEPYTVAWLMKKAGLTSMHYRNMIRNFDWSNESLQDVGTDTWCSMIARNIIKIGNAVFHALEKGLKGKIKTVSRDCLTTIAWLGCEITTSPNNLRYSACEILLSAVEQFLHPGLDLEERLLACLCIYRYASGKGMQKLIHFSEGVRESLRRLSNITWMAEELLKVADYFLPNKRRISCIHTQILEVGNNYCGAVSALVYYKGLLCSGYADGSIKVWDIKEQTAKLIIDIKEHRKAVTCFSVCEPGNFLLSGSADKTVRIWHITQMKLECIEVISTKEPIQGLDTHGSLILAVTQCHRMKVFDESRTVKDVCKSKHVRCIKVFRGRIYAGCMDSSIQELILAKNKEQEIKAPSKSWRMQSKAINSIVTYKDWLYGAGARVEGSDIKEWRRNGRPHMSIVPEKGANMLAMGVVEDFIYLNCSSATSILQIWLRGTKQKVGRLSAGSKITSLLTANDIVLCGTENGMIKGWIPL